MIAKIIGQLDNYLGEMHPSAYAYLQYNIKYNSMQYNYPKGYEPMELYTAFATHIQNSLNLKNKFRY